MCQGNGLRDIHQSEHTLPHSGRPQEAHDKLKAGRTIHYKGVPYRYTPEEVSLLNVISLEDSTTRKIQFIIDRDLARDKTLP